MDDTRGADGVTPPPDPFGGDLADIARSGAREWERDMAVWESDAETLRLRRRKIADVLWEAMQRGDLVSVVIAEHTFSGPLQAVRGDLAVLTVGDATVAVNTKSVHSVAMERRSGGVSGDRTYGSFKAYLGMLEVEGLVVRLVGDRLDVQGRIEVVATDHVLVESLTAAPGTTRWAVATPSIGAVIIRS